VNRFPVSIAEVRADRKGRELRRYFALNDSIRARVLPFPLALNGPRTVVGDLDPWIGPIRPRQNLPGGNAADLADDFGHRRLVGGTFFRLFAIYGWMVFCFISTKLAYFVQNLVEGVFRITCCSVQNVVGSAA
jgi:hypothetical protein